MKKLVFVFVVFFSLPVFSFTGYVCKNNNGEKKVFPVSYLNKGIVLIEKKKLSSTIGEYPIFYKGYEKTKFPLKFKNYNFIQERYFDQKLEINSFRQEKVTEKTIFLIFTLVGEEGEEFKCYKK